MKEIIKKRSIKVTGISCKRCENTITSGLKKLDGVKQVKVDKKGTVYIEYDLMKINLNTIEKTIQILGYTPAPGLLHKIKTGWIHYTEENEYSNKYAVHHSCCTGPDVHTD